MEVLMQRRILVVLNTVGAFLIGGVVLAGCGAGTDAPPAEQLVTSSSPISTAATWTTPTTSSPVPASSSATTAVVAPVTTDPPATKAPTTKAAAKTTATHAPASCGGDYYVNSDGNCIHRPAEAPTAPAGATAKCNDGTYSFSAHRSGTCSRHGGVATWL
jgi:hypothetical protein